MSVNIFAFTKRRIKRLARDCVSDLSLLKGVNFSRIRSITSHKSIVSFERDGRVHHVKIELIGYGSSASVKVSYFCMLRQKRLFFPSVDDFINFF